MMSTDKNIVWIASNIITDASVVGKVCHMTSCLQRNQQSDGDDDYVHVNYIDNANNAVSQSTIHEMKRSDSMKSTETFKWEKYEPLLFAGGIVGIHIFYFVLFNFAVCIMIECDWPRASGVLETVAVAFSIVTGVFTAYASLVITVYFAADPTLSLNFTAYNLAMIAAIHACYFSCCYVGYDCDSHC